MSGGHAHREAHERLRALPEPVGGGVHGARRRDRQARSRARRRDARGMEFGTGSHINIPIAVLIWLMIYPMMLKIDFASIRGVGKRPGGLAVTLVVNWLVKPFSMAFLGWLFFRHVFAPWIAPGARERVHRRRDHPRRRAVHGDGVRLVVPLRRRPGLHARAGRGERPDHARRVRPDREVPACPARRGSRCRSRSCSTRS